MKALIILLVFIYFGSFPALSQIFNSAEKYSGTIDEIQDSILRKKVLAVQDCLIHSRNKNKEVKKIFSNTKDTVFTFGGSGLISFQRENEIFSIIRFTVWFKREYDFPSYSYTDLKIKATESYTKFPCNVFSTRKRSLLLFHCVYATIDNIPYTVIFISDTLHGFLGRVLIKTN